MVKIIVDVEEQLNNKLRLYAAENDSKSKAKAIIKILEEKFGGKKK